MQREIKFRVWSKTLKAMFWFDLMWGNHHAMGGGWIGAVPWGEERKYCPSNIMALDPDECEFMQFTTLHDCHGKEIWEGDKLQYKMDSAGEYVKQVEFKDGSFGFYQHTDYFRNFSDVDLSKYQVIGNIWEE